MGITFLRNLHLSVDGSLSVKQAHDLTDHLADELTFGTAQRKVNNSC